MIAFALSTRIFGLNTRKHWAVVKKERQRACLNVLVRKLASWPAIDFVRLVRVYGARCRKLDDDNLCGGFKATRDGVADGFGFRDDSKLQWQYAQERGTGNWCRVEIHFKGES